MDFGKILDDWDAGLRKSSKKKGTGKADEAARSVMQTWLDAHGVPDKDSARDEDTAPADKRLRLKRMPVQDTIDLHGMNAADAKSRLYFFLEDARHRGLEKVLIIPGKGNHTSGEGVLRKMVLELLESCSFTGEWQWADRSQGGSGALWVILRERKNQRSR